MYPPPFLESLPQEEKTRELGRKFRILRRSAGSLIGDTDVIHPNESYSGNSNPLALMTVREGRFICSFDNVDNFPFGAQVCAFKFWIMGTDNLLTQLNLESLTYVGCDTVKQYSIGQWGVERDNLTGTAGKAIRVSVSLGRKLLNIIMVTYLPTILMNIINQATNYISDEDKFSLIYTINITCMMVLASVYLSVSSSLPTTPNIKPVEVWLLFNLAYPFLVILINICLQVNFK